jgi:hypothetical protein
MKGLKIRAQKRCVPFFWRWELPSEPLTTEILVFSENIEIDLREW